MFRIVCDPSTRSIELYLIEIRSGSLMFVVCLVGVWQRNFEPVVCVYGTPCTESETYADVGLRDGGPVFRAPLRTTDFFKVSVFHQIGQSHPTRKASVFGNSAFSSLHT